MAVFTTARAERLRDKRVQADQDAFTEKGEDDEEAGSNADSADGFCRVREAANHHGVHDDHAHPADFGQDERESEAQSGAKFAPKDGGEGHEHERRR